MPSTMTTVMLTLICARLYVEQSWLLVSVNVNVSSEGNLKVLSNPWKFIFQD